MRPEQTDLQELFFKGSYQEVIGCAQARGVSTLLPTELTFLIGALSYNGQQEQSERLFLDLQAEFSLVEETACRFFLGVAFYRFGFYQRGRFYFAQNLWSARKYRDDRWIQFYAFQGLGFYQYFNARYLKAQVTAARSLIAAQRTNFSYGKALAGDLYGHTLVQLGHLQAGFLLLEQAKLAAEHLGHGGLAKSIQISQIVYRAQFGLNDQETLDEIHLAIENLEPQNAHAQSNLQLELANQLILRGRLAEASEVLQNVSTRIYQTRHSRYASLLSLRLAEIQYRSGQYTHALLMVRNVRLSLAWRQEGALLVKALAFEIKILRQLKLAIPMELDEQLRRKSNEMGQTLTACVLSHGKNKLAEDKISALQELAAKKGPAAIEKIIAAGYLGLLPETLQIDGTRQVLVLGLVGRDVTVFNHGEIFRGEKEIPKLLFDLLISLASGEMTKHDLILKLWGYDYHPLRHDGLIYQAIASLRRHLGSRHHFIQTTDRGYRLSCEVQIAHAFKAEALPVKKSELSVDNGPSFNPRQQKILKLLAKHSSVNVEKCLAQMKVSDMTVRRDLTEMIRQGTIEKVGKARATRYILAKGKL